MQHLASFFRTVSAVPTSKTSLQKCNYAPVSVLNFKSFSAVPTSKESFQISLENTILRPYFQMLLRMLAAVPTSQTRVK